MVSSPDGGRLLGYARVSTDDQDLSLQIDALEKHGISRTLLFTDKLFGARSDRLGLAKYLETLQTGDVLVVWRLDRWGRSVRHLITIVEDLRWSGSRGLHLDNHPIPHGVALRDGRPQSDRFG